jgi:hypothetical protein
MNANATAAHAAIQQTRQHYRHLRLDLPAKLVDTLAAIEARRERPYLRADPRAILDAVSAALAAGKDPATDKAVQTALARQQLATTSGLGALLDEQDAADQAAALREAAPTILEDLSRVVDQAGAVLEQARAMVPNLDLATPAALHSSQGSLIAMWGQAKDAADRLQRAVQVWQQVVSACRLASLSGSRNPLILADLTPDELARLNGRDAMAPVHAGHPLKLATPETYKQRCQRIDDHAAAVQAARAKEARTGRREAAAVA